MGGSVAVLMRLRDWRIGVLTALLAMVAGDALFHMFMQIGARPLSLWHSPYEFLRLSLSCLSFTVVILVERMIVEQRTSKRAARIEQDYFEQLFDAAPEAIVVLDHDDRVLRVNSEFTRMFGYPADEAVGNRINELIVPPDLREQGLALTQAVAAGQRLSIDTIRQRKNGRRLHVSILSRPITDESGKVAVYGIYRDITKRKSAEDELVRRATHDALTGLPNRTVLLDRLERSLAQRHRDPDHGVAVLFLNLDRFKFVNDSLGHVLGDELLIAVARRLKRSLRPTDTIARFGGDEFVVLLDSIDGLDEANRVASRIHREFGRPFVLTGTETYVTASIGIAVSRSANDKAVDLLRDADTALHRAKALGASHDVVFDGHMRARAVTVMRLQNELRRAVERRELTVFYQPIVSLETRRVTNVEALVRWNHPERGLIGPTEFIELAEETGLIVAIDQWVLNEACCTARHWQNEIPHDDILGVSVNLSAREFERPELAQVIAKVVQQCGIDPRLVTLEVTESALLDHLLTGVGLFRELRETGIRIHLDDFGTGYSSLSYLHRFQVDALKIDRSFVRNMATHAKHREIVRTIVSLARSLKMDVIAEGVESEEQLALLTSMECTHAQGFYFSRPLTADATGMLLSSSGLPGAQASAPV